MNLLTRTEAAARCRVSLAGFVRHVAPDLTPKRIGRRVFYRETWGLSWGLGGRRG